MKQKTKFLIVFITEFVLISIILLLIYFAGKKPYTVTFDTDGGVLVSGELVQRVEEMQDAALPVVSKAGYVFSEWDIVKRDGKDITLKAVWEYEITEGLIYNIVEGSDYCTVKGCYKDLRGDVYIPDRFGDLKVLGIDAEAFKDCKYIENVYLRDGILSIGDRAFEGCTSLKNAVIPESVHKIGTDVFKGCTELTGEMVQR